MLLYLRMGEPHIGLSLQKDIGSFVVGKYSLCFFCIYGCLYIRWICRKSEDTAVSGNNRRRSSCKIFFLQLSCSTKGSSNIPYRFTNPKNVQIRVGGWFHRDRVFGF